MTATSRIAQEAETKNPVKDSNHSDATQDNIEPVENRTIESVPPKPVKHVTVTDLDEENINENTALRTSSLTSESLAEPSVDSDNYVKLTGTITRGKKKGQSVDVVLNISREELETMETIITTKKSLTERFKCSPVVGLHIFLWTAFCVPLVMVFSCFYSFYMGTITWYNIFTFFSEEKPVIYKILVTPFLILFYPFLIVTCSIGFGIYSGFIQISWFWDSWVKEVSDVEKGFYGWLCNFLHLSECSPYEVIILTNNQQDFYDKPVSDL